MRQAGYHGYAGNGGSDFQHAQVRHFLYVRASKQRFVSASQIWSPRQVFFKSFGDQTPVNAQVSVT